MKPKFGDNLSLLYTDTDSFYIEIKSVDFYKEIEPDVDEWFDTSNFPSDFRIKDFPIGKNDKSLGFFKDESKGKGYQSFIGLRSKQYVVKEMDDSIKMKCKGVTKAGMKEITYEDYKKCLTSEKEMNTTNIIFRSRNHTIYTEEITKKTLDGKDEKRKILDDRIHTLPWGYKE